MRARVLLHVRDHAGATVVTPIPFADLMYGADSVDEAIEAVKPKLARRLTALDPVDRLAFADPPDGLLIRVPTTVRRDKSAEPLPITLGIVVTARTVSGKPVRAAYSPILPPFELASPSAGPDELAKRAAERVASQIRKWSLNAVLSADEPADTRLLEVELEIEASGSPRAYDDGGDDDEPPAGILEELGVDLTKREGGRIDRRDELVRRALETLAADGRSSVMLVGPPDVGKSALVHEIARRVAAGDVPSTLKGRSVWRISANELIAGAQYTGQWQERVRRLVVQARETRAIVVMGDPVGIVDAGRWSQSDNNVSRYLRTYVESGEITLVCECTPEQLAAAQKKEPSFVDAFHRIEVPEPNADETRQIAAAAAARLAEHAGLEVTDGAIDAAVTLTKRFEAYRSFPGKAVRLLEDAVRERDESATTVDRRTVTEAFARRTGMPLSILSDAVPLDIDDVRRHFERRVLGQPEATETMVDAVAVLKAGLNDPEKPLASFFFVGPTGVGKTELAKALAEFLFGSRERMVRLDMGEYASADAAQRLVGTAWGSEGELTRRVREQPFCVVLLDEIEKAHWSVFDALLAALGEGRLTDASGRTADFRNAIVVMTSNLGAARANTTAVGFVPPADTAGQSYVEAAEKFFRPEFFNRIDRIVVFHPLGADVVRQIARRELDELLERDGIVRRGLRIAVDDAVVERVAAAGFHPRYGARPLQREIERAVSKPLARVLLTKSPKPDDIVHVRLRDGSVSVTVEPVQERPPAERRRERRAAVDDTAFSRTERLVEELARRFAADEAAAFADQIRPSIEELMALTHDASFWDEPGRARSTLQRLYRLERSLDAFEGLQRRVDGLGELARRVRETRDRTRLREIADAVSEIDDRLLILRLELAAAAAGAETDAAVIRITPIGPGGAEWAGRLLAMYETWAERTGREAVAGEQPFSLAVEGLATYELLRGEIGLHRHVKPDRTESLASVAVSAAGGEDDDPETVVVRVYEEGKRRVVRDPRTGARVSHVASVLGDGVIDPFLIAWLHGTEPARGLEAVRQD